MLNYCKCSLVIVETPVGDGALTAMVCITRKLFVVFLIKRIISVGEGGGRGGGGGVTKPLML